MRAQARKEALLEASVANLWSRLTLSAAFAPARSHICGALPHTVIDATIRKRMRRRKKEQRDGGSYRSPSR